MASRTKPTTFSSMFAQRSISLVPYFIYVIISASTCTPFAIPRSSPSPSSSSSSSSICHQTIQRDYRTGRPALKSHYSRRSLTPTIITNSQHPSLICGKTDDTRLHASKTRSIDKSSLANTPKTLYEILGVPSDATRSEIKRAYIALARETHPDAIRQKNNDKNDGKQGEGDAGAEPLTSFDTIAQAYQVLTTPLERTRYDRKLRAKEFTQDVEQAIDNFGESDLFRKVVNPILRRGAVTTRKGWNAAVGASDGGDGKTKDVSESDAGVETGNDVASLIDNVVKAGKEGWKQADQLEVIEESREIEEKAREIEKAALVINDKLSDMVMNRIRLSLKTPNAPLTSLDALRCLDGMNTMDTVTFLDRTVRLRHTTSYDIDLLSQTETEFEIKEEEHRLVSEDLEQTEERIRKTKKDVEDAEKAEIRARKALEEAVNLVSSLKKEVDECERSLLMKENLYRRTKVDAKAKEKEVTKRRETVRLSLLRKEMSTNESGDDKETGELGIGINEDSSKEYEDISYSNRMEQIERYLKEENDLIDKISGLEEEASHLREKSRALVEKAMDDTKDN